MSPNTLTALHVGERLVRDAVWHDGRCTWMARALELRHGRPQLVHRPLAADLYEGTAGVGLALAEVHAATGDASMGETAAGAVRHALDRVDTRPAGRSPCLFTGGVGVGVAAVRAGRLLGRDDLADRGRRVLEDVGVRDEDPATHDFVGGRAGAVAGLLVGSRLSGSQVLADRAAALGDALSASADVMYRWATAYPRSPRPMHRTGLAHGAAGIAHAFTELSVATGERRFTEAARRAIEFEDRHFDPLAGNWVHAPVAAEGAPPPTPGGRVLWCHGAVGIAASRFHAWRAGGRDGDREMAARGLRTTARWLRAAVRSARGSFCLCHGLAGNAEVLADCAGAAPGDAEAFHAVVADVAGLGREEWDHPDRVWPCAPDGSEHPGLMTGLAGIARFYLRLDDPGLPSVLVVSAADARWER